jgi:hypothetical protein
MGFLVPGFEKTLKPDSESIFTKMLIRLNSSGHMVHLQAAEFGFTKTYQPLPVLKFHLLCL